jgi:hypothetical protein
VHVDLIYTLLETQSLVNNQNPQSLLNTNSYKGTRTLGTDETDCDAAPYTVGDVVRITCAGFASIDDESDGDELTLTVTFDDVAAGSFTLEFDAEDGAQEWLYLMTVVGTIKSGPSILCGGIYSNDSGNVAFDATGINLGNPAEIDIIGQWTFGNAGVSFELNQCVIEYLFTGDYPVDCLSSSSS